VAVEIAWGGQVGVTSGSSSVQPPSFTPARRHNLGEDVAEQVRHAILRGQFTPGQHLREEELAARLQVSRGPVREALALLEREGLVEVARNRGAAVVALSRADLEEVYDLRMGLEVVATQLATRRAQEPDFRAAEAILQEFAAALDGPISEQEAARLDLSFHDVIYLAAGNRRLAASWASLRSQVYLFLLSRNTANADWREHMVGGHRAILDALRSRDEVAAVELISQHIAYAFARIESAFGVGVGEPRRLIPPLLPSDRPGSVSRPPARPS
jgi:DNA-binding GntR family transcriptional regulator